MLEYRIKRREQPGIVEYNHLHNWGGNMADVGDITVRRMTDADLREVKTIDRMIAGDERAISWPLEAEIEWAVNRPALSFVAELDGKVVGFLLGDIRVSEYGTDLKGWIDMVGISPEHQRLGRAAGDQWRRGRHPVRRWLPGLWDVTGDPQGGHRDGYSPGSAGDQKGPRRHRSRVRRQSLLLALIIGHSAGLPRDNVNPHHSAEEAP